MLIKERKGENEQLSPGGSKGLTVFFRAIAIDSSSRHAPGRCGSLRDFSLRLIENAGKPRRENLPSAKPVIHRERVKNGRNGAPEGSKGAPTRLSETDARRAHRDCTGSPFRMLFGPRAATRLNGPSVYDDALLTQRYVRAVKGEKERER